MVGQIRLALVGDEAWKRQLSATRKEIGVALEAAVERGLIAIEGGTKKKLDNEVLQRRSSTLFKSINRKLTRRGLDSYGEVGTPVVYGKTHELGLTIEYPSRGMSITFPQRPFLQPTFDELREQILDDIAKALQEGIDAA